MPTPNADALQGALVSRYGGREPLALALEHIERFPKRTGDQSASRAQATERARALTIAAASAELGEFNYTGFTCGYFRTADGLAIIPVWGDVGPRRYYWPWVWYEDLAAAANAAAKDGDVKAILYQIDSPGGYVTGAAECAAAIADAAALKPSAAYANDLAASAGYWLACAASRITAPATAIVGSIGALCIHDDVSRALDDMGVTVSIIRSAARKAETNPFEPLSQAARQQLQHEITICADAFIADVAKLRGIDEVTIRATQAACLTMDAALPGRFADASESFDAACAALLARAAAPPTPAPAPTPAAKAKPSRAGKAAQSKPTHPRASAKARSQTMDPTTLPPEEQIARYDQIDAIMAEEPADDNAKIGQFVQICGIINAETTETEVTEEEAAPEDEEAAPAARAKKGNPHAGAIAASKEGKANPAGALAAISQGLTLAQFKALAPSLAKGGNLAQRMENQPGAQRLNGDAGNAQLKAQSVPAPANVYANRAQQARGGKR